MSGSTLLDGVRSVSPFRVTGRVELVRGLLLEATLPGARVGEVATITDARAQVLAEVVGFAGSRVQLFPLGSATGLGDGAEVASRGESLTVGVGPALVAGYSTGWAARWTGGRCRRASSAGRWTAPAPNRFAGRGWTWPLPLGVRAIDGLCTVGRGQRLGLFAGAGVGKSTLLGQMVRHTRAEVTVVALVGERGRELREFVEDALGTEGLRRSVVVCATSDEPALFRLRAGFVATAIAEWFREQGGNVLFLLDSVTRLARAQREVGLAAGEPPARQGYPPSVFSMLPRLLERTGNSARGHCTALYACLVAGDDLEDPIADEVRGILDGHVVLDRRIAERGRWPAVDVLASLSRVMPQVTTARSTAAWRRGCARCSPRTSSGGTSSSSAPTSPGPMPSPTRRSTGGRPSRRSSPRAGTRRPGRRAGAAARGGGGVRATRWRRSGDSGDAATGRRRRSRAGCRSSGWPRSCSGEPRRDGNRSAAVRVRAEARLGALGRARRRASRWSMPGTSHGLRDELEVLAFGCHVARRELAARYARIDEARDASPAPRQAWRCWCGCSSAVSRWAPVGSARGTPRRLTGAGPDFRWRCAGVPAPSLQIESRPRLRTSRQKLAPNRSTLSPHADRSTPARSGGR